MKNHLTELLLKHKEKHLTARNYNPKVASMFSCIKMEFGVKIPLEIEYFYTYFDVNDDVLQSLLYSNFKDIVLFYNKEFVEYVTERWINQYGVDENTNQKIEDAFSTGRYEFNIKNNCFNKYIQEVDILQSCFNELNSDTDLCFSIGTYLTGDCGGNVYLVLNADAIGFITTDFGYEEFLENSLKFHYNNLEKERTWYCLDQYKDYIEKIVSDDLII